MNLDEAIRGRRSVRKYTDVPVPDDVIKDIIEAGLWAPSACNRQGSAFIVINEREKFDELLKGGSAAFLKNVNQAILVLYDNRTDNLEYRDHIQSACAAIQNMLLKAYELGVGTCWINNIPNKKKLKKIFNIPWNYEPVALISMGYIDYKPVTCKRKKTVEDCVSYNTFDLKDTVKKDKKYLSLKIKRVLRKIYKAVPGKKLLLKFAGKYEKKFDN